MHTFVIAEAGINHNGSLQTAKKLADAAKTAQVDCIKFQTFVPENLVTGIAEMAEYQNGKRKLPPKKWKFFSALIDY